MLLAELARLSTTLAATSGRKEKIALLAARLAALAPKEIAPAVAWLSGDTLEGRLGFGPAASRALDAGPAAPAPTLTIAGTAERFAALGAASRAAKGSAGARRAALAALFALATRVERDFLARLIVGELRQGALEGVKADAIAAAAKLPSGDVRRAIMLAGAVPPVAHAALTEGAAGLGRFGLALYEPLKPMLASPASSLTAALEQLGGTALLDYKLDGARVQAHKGADGTRCYSRTGRDVTASLPEAVEAIDGLDARTIVLDGEVLALGTAGKPRPFQDTMRRVGRKLDDAALRETLPLSLFAFDCLHVDGADLIDRPLAQRAQALADTLPAELIVPRTTTNDVDAAQRFLDAALAAGHEGLMAKAPDSIYEAGARGASWLKIKVAHTLDLVVLAAEWGSGRRQGWLSNLHLGARDEAGGFVMLGKTYKGLTDELLVWQTAQLLARQVTTDGYVVEVRPELVVEIAFNELQTSRRYPGGLALRFARVVRYRADKTAADADSIATVRALAAKR
jgi:DNA ligase-1